MSVKNPIVAITGSSGAGTTTVMNSFQHIFRREGIRAQILEGDSMHRFNRLEMREEVRRRQAAGNFSFSHFSPEANLLSELASTFQSFGKSATGRVRKYIHDEAESVEYGQEPGTFTPWRDIEDDAEMLFYEGLHGGYVGEDAECYHVLGGNQSDMVNVARIAKTRLFKARRTPWSVAQPKQVRQIFLDAKGKVSTNEK